MMRRARFPREARYPAAPAAQRVAQHTARAHLPTPAATVVHDGQVQADKVPLILFSFDLRNRLLLHCNRHCHSVLGYSSSDLIALGMGLGERILHPDSRAQLLKTIFSKPLTTARSLNWDCRIRHHDGSWRWLRIRVRPSAFGPDGTATELIGSAEDVTRHRAAVEALRENRYLLRQVVDLVPNLIYIYDLHLKRNVYANRCSERVLGYTSDQLLAFPSGTLLPFFMSTPAAEEQLMAHWAEVSQLADGETRTIEFAVTRRDGMQRWLRSVHTCFARDEKGQVRSVIGVAEDITEQRLADEQSRAAAEHLAEQDRLFREVINALPHPIYLKDGDGRYLLANEAMAAIFGLTPQELVRCGETNSLPTSPVEMARYRSQDQQVLATGKDLTQEESFQQRDGNLLWFSSVKRLFMRANGTAQVLGVDSNITELKRTQQALEAAIAAAESDSQAKQDFLANMSHEIRTPLHGILGLTGVLAKTTLSRSQHDYLRLMGDSAEHLLMVLNDVLTTARLGAGKLRPEAILFNPEELLTNCAALLRPRAREKGLRMRIEKPSPLPPVLGDAHRLRQVLLNLVSNAIKFTETGRVVLRCRPVPAPRHHTEPPGTVWLQFTVSDTGVGIAPETLDKVFEPFTQAAASTDREYGGSGLGLSISEGLVQLMGGILRVSSEVGQGSTFAFTLAFMPIAASPVLPAPVAPIVAPAMVPAGRVLLVEDNMVNSLLAETVLRNWGWQVTTAANGVAAIQLFEHRAFDIVLMDIQMPGMDGETAARVLREHPDPCRAATPVIALTARAQAGEAERLQATGFAGYLAKPYREEQLLETMQAVLARHSIAAEPTPIPYRTMPSASPPLYNLSNVRQLVRSDETIVRRLAWAFIETTPAILTALDEALTRADWQAVSDAAHHLKSSLDGLGVESLRHVIREIEAYSDAAPALNHASQQVAKVRAITEQVMADLRTEYPEQLQPGA